MLSSEFMLGVASSFYNLRSHIETIQFKDKCERKKKVFHYWDKYGGLEGTSTSFFFFFFIRDFFFVFFFSFLFFS